MSNDKITGAASVIRWYLEEHEEYPSGENVARALKDPAVISEVDSFLDIESLRKYPDYFGRMCYILSAEIKQTYNEEEKLASSLKDGKFDVGKI